VTEEQGLNRRDALKTLLALGAAAPLAWTGTLPARAAGLTSQQLAGQRVIFSYSGLIPPSALLQQISAGQAAGVIFFGGNISSESRITGVIQQLRQAQQQSPVASPLLLMTDQEGGLVRRLPGAPTMSEKQIGASSNPASAASSAGTGAGQNLAGVGMNVNLAPVLDVYYKSGNFIDQFQRSYSNNASVVTSCGQAFITAQQQTGVAATAKHFPGLGSATKSQNTGTGPVTLKVSLSGLRSKDEVPYPAAIAAGVKLIMASWAVYPALDTGHPGDVLAAQAGMDLLLCSAQDPSQGQAVVTALASALDGGQLHRRRAAGDRAPQRPVIESYVLVSSCFHSAMATSAHSACRRANSSAAAVPRHGSGRNWAGRPGSIHGNRRQACTRSMTRTSGSELTSRLNVSTNSPYSRASWSRSQAWPTIPASEPPPWCSAVNR
jgi:beta-N-acetylhexosaminidase